MRRMQHTNVTASWGFTLVELVVSMTVVSIIMLTIGVMFTSSYQEAFKTKGQSEADNSLQSAFDIIEKDIRYSISFNGTSGVNPFIDRYGMSTNAQSTPYGWNYSLPSLILTSYASNQRSSAVARHPVYENSPISGFNCTNLKMYQPKIRYMTVYFVRDSSLYRRILVDKTTPRCNNEEVAQKQSCPMDAFNSGTVNSSCEARDEELAQNVSALSIEYYNSSGDRIPQQYTPGGTEHIAEAQSVKMTLRITPPPGNHSRSRTMQITRIN